MLICYAAIHMLVMFGSVIYMHENPKYMLRPSNKNNNLSRLRWSWVLSRAHGLDSYCDMPLFEELNHSTPGSLS